MPPLSLPKAPVERTNSAPRAVPAAVPAVTSHTGEVRGLKPPSTLNCYVVPLQSAGTQGPNGVGLSAAPKTALPAPTGVSGSGAALSLPALPKLTPPPGTLLKPPIADLMSNSGLDADGLPDFFCRSFSDTAVIALSQCQNCGQ